MDAPPGLPESHDPWRPPDTRGGLLGRLTFSIGHLMLKCKLEIERAGALGAAPARAQPQLVPDNGRRRIVRIPADEAATTCGPGSRLPALRPARHLHLHLLNGENCTVVLSDVAGFGARTRTDEDRRIIRDALFRMTHTLLRGITDMWSWDDRGDGLLAIIPPAVPTARVIRQLHRELPAALEGHNHAHQDPARIQLRVAISVGPVASDSMGVSGQAIIDAARLVEAPLLKTAMAASGASLGLVAPAFVYENVIRHGRDLAGYSQVQADVKESALPAWMKLFGPAVPLSGDTASAAA
jgi:class 3 adenylate cyclase